MKRLFSGWRAIRFYLIIGVFLVSAMGCRTTRPSQETLMALVKEDPTILFWVNPLCERMRTDELYWGPYVRHGEHGVMTVANNIVYSNHDGGIFWPQTTTIVTDDGPGKPNIRGGWDSVLLTTEKGTLVLVYLDMDNRVWEWDRETDELEAKLDVWAIRSTDGGLTWTNRVKLQDGYCGALQDIIQTSDGTIVVPVQQVLTNPVRHGTRTHVSTDDGIMWRRSNLIDIGGHGNHAGALEGTLVELKDGRIWMLLRTPYDYFWQAYSEDNGLTWTDVGRSDIDASCSPGYLTRLTSGRLVLVWNRLDTELGLWEVRTQPGDMAEVAASIQRSELSISFSDNDGENWTEPVVIMRKYSDAVHYPYVFEYEPGVLWVSAHEEKFRIEEKDFIPEEIG